MKIVKFDTLEAEHTFIFNDRGFKVVPATIAAENGDEFNAIDLKTKDCWFFDGNEQVAILEGVK